MRYTGPRFNGIDDCARLIYIQTVNLKYSSTFQLYYVYKYPLHKHNDSFHPISLTTAASALEVVGLKDLVNCS